LQMNLPIVPITDLAVKNDNLIAATQGRSFWIIDDLTVLHQVSNEMAGKDTHLFKPMTTYRMGGGNGATSRVAGTNHPGGALVHFFVKDTAAVDTVMLSFFNSADELIRTFSSHPDKDEKEEKLSFGQGLNTINWDMRYPGATTFDGMILWWATTSGPKVVPGTYEVVLSTNGEEQSQTFEIVKDPRLSATQQDLETQLDFLLSVRDKLSETNEAIITIRKVRQQINDVLSKTEDENITELGKAILEDTKTIEEALYQTQNESGQDPLNFPIRLNNKLGHLASLEGVGDFKPTDQAITFKKEVTGIIDEHLSKLTEVLDTRIPEFNKAVYESRIDAVQLQD